MLLGACVYVCVNATTLRIPCTCYLVIKRIFILIFYLCNAVVGVHDFGPRCTRGALGVPISATRELLNNSDRRPLHQVHERCRSPVCLQHCLKLPAHRPIVYAATHLNRRSPIAYDRKFTTGLRLPAAHRYDCSQLDI